MKQRALGDLLLKPARQKTKGAARPGRARLPGKAALQKLDGMVDQDRAENPLRFGEHVLQGFFDVLAEAQRILGPVLVDHSVDLL